MRKHLHLQLTERGLAPEIVRIGKYEDGDLCSSRFVVQRIIEVRGKKDEIPGNRPKRLSRCIHFQY